MKVRAKTNGNIIDLPEDHPLIKAGIYEPVDDEGKVIEMPEPTGTIQTKESTASDDPSKRGRHQRRDMRAKE